MTCCEETLVTETNYRMLKENSRLYSPDAICPSYHHDGQTGGMDVIKVLHSHHPTLGPEIRRRKLSISITILSYNLSGNKY